MQWLGWMFGKRTESKAASPSAPSPAATGSAPQSAESMRSAAAPSAPRGKEMVFSRSTPNPQPAAPGQERQTYLLEVAVVFGDAGAIDAGKSFKDDYGFDELGVSECVQLAEEVWAVQLMPNPMRMSDYADMMRRFPTLESIMKEAEAVAAERRPAK